MFHFNAIYSLKRSPPIKLARFNFSMGYEFHSREIAGSTTRRRVMRVERKDEMKFRKLERRFREFYGVAMAVWPRKTCGWKITWLPSDYWRFSESRRSKYLGILSSLEQGNRFYRSDCVYYWKTRKADDRVTFLMFLWSCRPENLFSEALPLLLTIGDVSQTDFETLNFLSYVTEDSNLWDFL